MLRFRFSAVRILVVAFVALFVAGCAGASGMGATTSAYLFLLALLVGGAAACTQPIEQERNADGWTIGEDTQREDGREPPPDSRGEGTWTRCCENGRISTCFCPANVACNYGRFTHCGGNRCSISPYGCPPDATDATDPPDSTPDVSDSGREVESAEGRWVQCCRDGHIETCFCPANVACNYGWFQHCGGDRCAHPGQGCSVDAGDAPRTTDG